MVRGWNVAAEVEGWRRGDGSGVDVKIVADGRDIGPDPAPR